MRHNCFNSKCDSNGFAGRISSAYNFRRNAQHVIIPRRSIPGTENWKNDVAAVPTFVDAAEFISITPLGR